ncbi:MAG: hypothetical protein Q9226_009193 [Calogaya cf. arnoldii]
MARPPYKHRFLYRQLDPRSSSDLDGSPLQKLLTELLPSEAFRKWLQLATGLSLSSRNLTARRFRRGKDYTLATGYTEEESQLELIMAVTPSDGWVADGEVAGGEDGSKPLVPSAEATGKDAPDEVKDSGASGVGGYIAYMAGDEEAAEDDDDQSNDGVEVPLDLSTGARASKPSTQKKGNKKADPAVYRAVDDDEDDGVLFSMPACWNTLGLVLRDKGVMRFVKYVSRQAKGDRWDILGEFGVDASGEDDDETDQQQAPGGVDGNEETSETEIDTDYDKSTEIDSDDGLHGLLLRRLWIPLMFWILPIIREVNTFNHRSHARLGIEEAESAGPIPPLPHAFHGRFEPSGLHLSLALRHGDVLAVEGDVLNTFLVVPLRSSAVDRGNGWKSYLIQPFTHQTLPTDRLHDLKDKIALLRKTDYEFEITLLAAKAAGGNGGWGEVEDLEGADSKAEKAVHCFPVVRSDDAYFGYGA